MWDKAEGKVYTGMGRGLPVAPILYVQAHETQVERKNS